MPRETMAFVGSVAGKRSGGQKRPVKEIAKLIKE